MVRAVVGGQEHPCLSLCQGHLQGTRLRVALGSVPPEPQPLCHGVGVPSAYRDTKEPSQGQGLPGSQGPAWGVPARSRQGVPGGMEAPSRCSRSGGPTGSLFPEIRAGAGVAAMETLGSPAAPLGGCGRGRGSSAPQDGGGFSTSTAALVPVGPPGLAPGGSKELSGSQWWGRRVAQARHPPSSKTSLLSPLTSVP